MNCKTCKIELAEHEEEVGLCEHCERAEALNNPKHPDTPSAMGYVFKPIMSLY